VGGKREKESVRKKEGRLNGCRGRMEERKESGKKEKER
jgi:hypothetical protein